MNDDDTNTIRIAPVIHDDAHAREVEAAIAEIDDARRAIVDAAAEWDQTSWLRGPECCEPGSEDEHDATVCRDNLREALFAWRKASERFLAALSRRAGGAS